MSVRPHPRALRLALVGLAFGAWQPGAGAAGFQLFEQNASGLGNAYAGQAAAAEDASAIFFNPAGLTRLPGRRLAGAIGLIRPQVGFTDAGSCAPFAGAGAGSSACPLGPPGNLGHALGGNGGDAGSLAAVPAAYVSWEHLPGRLWLGVGLNAPFGLSTEWEPGWVGRFHAIQSEVQTLNLNPTVAWRVSPQLSLGAGLNVQHLKAELGNAVSYRAAALASGNAGLIAATPSGAEGPVTVEGDDWGWGWNVGVLFEPTPATRLGLAYRSKIRYTLQGDVRFADRPAALGLVPQLADGRVSARIELPDTFSVALSQQVGARTQLLVDGTWTGWRSIQDLAIERADGPLAGQTLTSTPLRFRDSWRVGLGVNVQVDPAWKLRAGLAFDRSPVRDAYRTPRLPDADRTWYAIGAQWAFRPDAALELGYVYIDAKTAVGSLPNQEAATSAPRGSLVGRYDAHVNILSAQLSWSF